MQDVLRLDSLQLRNFRCFEECDIALHPSLTVLVAENGIGKSAILDAVGVALGLFVDTIADTQQSHGFAFTDVRRVRTAAGEMAPQPPTSFTATGCVDGARLTWSRTLPSADRRRARSTVKDASNLRRMAQKMRGRLELFAAGGGAPPPLPAVCFYGTGRLWSELRLREAWKTADSSKMGRTAGYLDCLSPSSSFLAFKAWYEGTAKALRSPTSRAYATEERPERLLAAVRKATQVVLAPTGWADLDWNFDWGDLVAEHPKHGRQPLSQLSDGVRNMIALVGDLAHRCVRLNPHFGEEAARLTPGVVLIDEVDMHLHPRWQQLVVELLRKAFAAMQFVVSTHSPHVLSTVDVESVRVVTLEEGKGRLGIPRFQTRGVESADVLAMTMGVDPVPPVEEAGWLREYRALVQTGTYDSGDGHALWVRLTDHFGADHPAMGELNTLRRLQEFKRQHQAAPERGT